MFRAMRNATRAVSAICVVLGFWLIRRRILELSSSDFHMKYTSFELSSSTNGKQDTTAHAGRFSRLGAAVRWRAGSRKMKGTIVMGKLSTDDTSWVQEELPEYVRTSLSRWTYQFQNDLETMLLMNTLPHSLIVGTPQSTSPTPPSTLPAKTNPIPSNSS